MPQGKQQRLPGSQSIMGGVPGPMTGMKVKPYFQAAYPVNIAGRMVNALGNPDPAIAKEMSTVELLKLMGNAGQDVASGIIGPATYVPNLLMDSAASAYDPQITNLLQQANRKFGLSSKLGMDKVVDDPRSRRDFMKAATAELPEWTGSKGPIIDQLMSLFNTPSEMINNMVEEYVVYPNASDRFRNAYNQGKGHPWRNFTAIDESDKRQRESSDMGPVKGRMLTDKNRRSSPVSIHYDRPDMQGGGCGVPSRVSKYPQFRSGRIPSE